MNVNDYIITLRRQKREDVLERIGTNISDADLRRYFGDDAERNIVKYSELREYSDINALLPKDKAYKIILFENDYNTGHWILLMRYGKTIEFFNSYGLKPNADFQFVSRIKNFFLGQDPDDLKRLLDRAKVQGYDVIYNKTRFQRMARGINTCGRWIILRIVMMDFFCLDLPEFIRFIKGLQDKYDYTPDMIVAHLII
jgi:hypothetical protein